MEDKSLAVLRSRHYKDESTKGHGSGQKLVAIIAAIDRNQVVTIHGLG